MESVVTVCPLGYCIAGYWQVRRKHFTCEILGRKNDGRQTVSGRCERLTYEAYSTLCGPSLLVIHNEFQNVYFSIKADDKKNITKTFIYK